MKPTEQTLQQIERAIRKIADKFPAKEEAVLLSDVHIRVNAETGELTAFDDDDREITRCIIEQWIDNKDDDFLDQIADILRSSLRGQSELVNAMSILRPFAFVLESEDGDEQHELYVVDGDTIIIDSALMEGLDKDLDTFFENLMKDS